METCRRQKTLVRAAAYVEFGKTIEEHRAQWQTIEPNSYRDFVWSLLQSYDGFEALRLFSLIRKAYLNKQNKEFTERIECLTYT